MNTHVSTRPEAFRSRIPVRVKSSNLVCKDSKICQKLPASETSSAKKTSVENFHFPQKELVKKSNYQAAKALVGKTSKTNQIHTKPSSAAVNNNKNTAKSSILKIKAPIKNPCIQIVSASAANSCKESKTTKKASSVSQTSRANETAAENFHPVKKEQVKNSDFQTEMAVTNKNIKNSKCTFSSSKINIQAAEKVSMNSRQNKNVSLLITNNVSEKENQEADDTSCFSAQKGIKFEANELFRKMILSEREISPSMCKIDPGLRLSSLQAQRPSAYQKFEIHPNPFKEALEAIANASAKRGTRKTLIQKDQKAATMFSPHKERNSFYTPCANPKEEVMKSLEAFKAKQMQKSALKSSKKKVTFNFNVEEYSEKVDDCDLEPILYKSGESRLTQINEGSKENTPSSPLQNRTETPGVTLESNKEPSVSSVEAGVIIPTGDKEKNFHSPTKERSEICTAHTKSTAPTKDIEHIGTLFYSSEKTVSVSSSPDIVCGDRKFTQETLNSHRTAGQLLFERNASGQVLKTSQAKLYTPRPISFFSNSIFLNDNTSPEFLAEKNPVPSLAPIYTPLALKNMAKNSAVSPYADFSPVRLKLDFAAAEKDTPKNESAIKNHASSTYKKIFTVQKRLDDLADQECGFLLLNESIPVVCGRYLQNPVAVTLTEGDEMHFLPIRL